MRVELTARGIARLSVAARPDPLWELAFSVRVLTAREGFGWWRRRVGSRLPSSMLALHWLFTGGPEIPAFLVPRAGEVSTGLATVLGTSAGRLRGELRRHAPQPNLPRWADELRNGSVGGLPQLVQAMREYFRVAIEPHWETVLAQVDADRAFRAGLLVSQGVGTVLESLRPGVEWQHAATESEAAQDDLVLTPTYFALRPEIVAGDGPARLAYPALHRTMRQRRGVPNAANTPSRALAALLGPTRAAALAIVAAGCSTSDLAARLGVTPSAVSKHTAVLREAGLIVTRRERNTVRHVLTPLGNAVLTGL